jgi:hypothetical protein
MASRQATKIAELNAKARIPKAENNPRPRSGGTVTVCCKLPSGLILRVYDFVERHVPAGAGQYRLAKVPVPREEEYAVTGYAVPFGMPHDKTIAGGYALTPGIPEDFFDYWLAQNKGHPAVKQGLIFAHRQMESARDMAKERAELRSGLEPLNPDKPGDRMGMAGGPKVEKAVGIR